MAKRILNTAFRCRDKFLLSGDDKIQWFPGHMKKGVEDIQSALYNIDAVIEVHDARIPFSGRNNQLRNIIHVRPHMLLLNKCDLADPSRNEEITAKLVDQGVSCVQFTQCMNQNIVWNLKSNIMPMLMKEIGKWPLHHEKRMQELNILVIGVPNVGKSTMLNKLRQTYTKKRKAAHVGAIPGITRSVMNKVRVNFDPDVFVVDTPGILSPKIGSDESGMRLAACDCIPGRIVGSDRVVDYLLYWHNKRRKFEYVDHYQLTGPTDDYMKFLAHVAFQKQLMRPVRDNQSYEKKFRVDFDRAADHVLKDFQTGVWGKVMFDDDFLDQI